MILNNRQVIDKNIEFYRKVAEVYDSYNEVNHPKIRELYINIFKKIFVYFKKLNISKLKILDVGCGSGLMEQYFDTSKNNITGVDVSESMLKVARKKYPNVKYLNTEILKFKTKTKYDLIIGNAILHHIIDYNLCLDKMVDLLKPNGCIFLGAEPNYFSYHYLKLLKRSFRFLPDNRRIKKDLSKDYEPIVEYHVFFSDGINPCILESKLIKKEFKKVNIEFSSREFIGSLKDRFNLPLIDFLPDFMMDFSGRFSRVFYLTAFRSSE